MKYFTYLLCLFISPIALAGFNGPTYHSRANCVNNESIAWDLTQARLFKTTSLQTDRTTMKQHILEIQFELTKRSAAVCWFEGNPLNPIWGVQGIFGYKTFNKGKEHIAWFVNGTSNCSVYDGWWNFDEDSDSNPGKKQDKNKLEGFA